MSSKNYSAKIVLLFLFLVTLAGSASAGDTIKVAPKLYHIDHQKNIIVINQSVAGTNLNTSELKRHLLLDDRYEFLSPIYAVNESASYKVECKDSVYTAYFTKLPIIHINTRNRS